MEELDFDDVLRLNDHLKFNGEQLEQQNLKELPHKNGHIPPAFVTKWNRKISLVKRVQEEESWILATSQAFESSSKRGIIYEGRFSIEKMFKNKKSGGFDLEKLQIKK